MDLPIPASSQMQKRNIPLICSICAKKSSFSDLSHLLTHISSKAHLANYFKVKVLAGSDNEDARQTYEQYNLWYAENEIKALMSNRMTKKPNIKTEPRSSGKGIKQEAEPSSLTSSVGSFGGAASIYPLPHTAFAPMYEFGAQPYAYAMKQDTPSEDEGQEPLRVTSHMLTKRKVKKQESPAGDAAEDDSSKLKGIFWPGMGLFDAATPGLRKKRNQKKDVSVSDRLAAMSEVITNDEMVFSFDGTWLKTRVISGYPNAEDDLLSGEELPARPAKAKRATRKRTLEAKEFNLGVESADADGPKPKKRGRKPQQPVTTMVQESHEESQDEEAMPPRRKKQKMIAVSAHEDDIKTNVAEALPEQPAAMAHLNTGFQQVYQPMGPMGFRPIEPAYVAGQSFYQYPPAGHNTAFPYEPAPMVAWDYFGQGVGNSLMNPFFFAGDFDVEDEDNEGTISAPTSES